MRENNFLLGFGEKLTEPIKMPPSGGEKDDPYSIDKARQRLSKRLETLVQSINKIPDNALPRSEAVAKMTLHPAYLAKSYYPGNLLRFVELRTVGSRQVTVHPEQWTSEKQIGAVSAALYIAGHRDSFARWAAEMMQWDKQTALYDLTKIEDIGIFPDAEKIKKIPKGKDPVKMEVVLHASGSARDAYILQLFNEYCDEFDGVADLERRRHIGGLCFVPVMAPPARARGIARFSYVRVVRGMPQLRPIETTITRVLRRKCELPREKGQDPTVRVAVFDGGIPQKSGLSRWVKRYRAKGTGPPVPAYMNHGNAVTSVLLFGPLEKGGTVPVPYAAVDHYRVIGQNSGKDIDLYDEWDRIEGILSRNQYEFINLSIGPDMPVEDDDVTLWTSKLDEYLASGRVLATVAVGNNGSADSSARLDRIQPPSDCVNGLAVGACNTQKKKWRRADYSAKGPGRKPGLVKPDGLAFGGTETELFHVCDERSMLKGIRGTSLSAPSVLRAAVGIRARLGNVVQPLALKALMIHRAETSKLSQREVGWGRFNTDVENLTTCDDMEATVIYQGQLTQGNWVRAKIPFPDIPVTGRTHIRATFCFSAFTDPEHPVHYTRSGLEIRFRPHSGRIQGKHKLPRSKSFFAPADLYPNEQELRDDAHKWETCLNRQLSFNPDSLKNPCFDIHYHAREQSGPAPKMEIGMPYALVVTVRIPKEPDLYNIIRKRYRVLQQLKPQVRILVRT